LTDSITIGDLSPSSRNTGAAATLRIARRSIVPIEIHAIAIEPRDFWLEALEDR